MCQLLLVVQPGLLPVEGEDASVYSFQQLKLENEEKWEMVMRTQTLIQPAEHQASPTVSLLG